MKINHGDKNKEISDTLLNLLGKNINLAHIKPLSPSPIFVIERTGVVCLNHGAKALLFLIWYYFLRIANFIC